MQVLSRLVNCTSKILQRIRRFESLQVNVGVCMRLVYEPLCLSCEISITRDAAAILI